MLPQRVARPVALSRAQAPCRTTALKRASVRVAAIPAAGKPNAFLEAETEEQFFGALNAGIEKGMIPKQLYPLWADFFGNYKEAIRSANLPTHDIKLTTQVQASIADVVLNQFVDPYTFPSYHQAIREPYDYFEFGQKYVGSLIDFSKSFLGHSDRFATIERQLAAGDNVIFLANHQSEADPGIFAHMLLDAHPKLAMDVVYVAGDRVITDPLCKPFSMGRNLFCVHSKRYMDAEPEKKAEKTATNRKTLRAMSEALARGGAILWIAPAGGRDRTNDADEYVPGAFDAGSVELMRTLAKKAESKVGTKTHLHPFAMYSAPLMPPPKGIVSELGERRMVNFTGVGVSVGEELKPDEICAGIEDRETAAATFTRAAYTEVCALYSELVGAIRDPASVPAGTFSQPWAERSAGAAAAGDAAPDGGDAASVSAATDAVLAAVVKLVDAAAAKPTQEVAQAVDRATQAVSDAVEAVAAAKGAAAAAPAAAPAAKAAAVQAVTKPTAAITDAVEAAADAVSEAAAEPAKAVEAAADAVAEPAQAASNAVEAAADAVAEPAQAASKAVSEAVDAVVKLAPRPTVKVSKRSETEPANSA